MERKVSVVILDSGIDQKHSVFRGIETKEIIFADGKWFETSDVPENGHGTAVASAIVKHEPTISELISLRINVGANNEADLQRLIAALEYVNTNINCDIINISMGTDCYSYELESICNQLSKKGIILVSAFANEGHVSYPAAFDSVIGIDTTTTLRNFNEYIYVKNSIVNIGIAQGIQRLAWLEQRYVLLSGNSFATPVMTARIVSALKSGINAQNIHKYLEQNAARVISGSNKNTSQPSLWIKKIIRAAVFPYNKETMSLVNFSEMLPFQLAKVFDCRFSGNVGLKVGTENFCVEDIDKCEYSGIDTFIIGHVDRLDQLAMKEYKKEIIQKCESAGIKVFTLDSEKCAENDSSHYSPRIFRTKETTDKFGKLYTIHSPVLAVIGTSSQQGKFTLQLKVRNYFLEQGYSVAQLSSEPEGELFGMDCVFPYGYNSNVQMNGIDTIEHVNALMHSMDIKNPDIIFAGIQSGICTLTFQNTLMYNLPSLEFLLGVNPDACIVCVNYHDTLEDIQRTITLTESLVKCKVVGVALFPLAYADHWHYMRNQKEQVDDKLLRERALQMQCLFRLPVAVMGNSDDEKLLFEAIIDFFGGE